MAQNRNAPAFQEYASSMMASIEYRTMSLTARGLLYSMRLECWVNKGLPANPSALAKVLGFDIDKVAAALPEVMPFFALKDALIVSPELDDYRAHLDGIRAKQVEGGKKGAAISIKRKSANDAPSTHQDTQGSTSGSTQGSLVKTSPVQTSQTQSSGSDVDDAWISDYDRASNGH